MSATAVLAETDAELALLGSMFMSPDAFALLADDIRDEWFSDPFARYLFNGARDIHRSGSHLSPQAVVSRLPEDCGGMSRGQFYAHACANAVPAVSIPGLIEIVKDRWARRRLLEVSKTMADDATSLSANPYETASGAVMSLDTVSAFRGQGRVLTLDAAMAKLAESHENGDGLAGATTGLRALDNKLNGYKRGQLYVVAGRPGMGKSAFMCSSLRRTAAAGHGVIIFSLEMTAEEIAARCSADVLDNMNAPAFGDILRGKIRPDQLNDLTIARDSMAGLPLMVDASPRLTFSEMAGRARQQKAKMEAQGISLGVVCIDHMGLVTPSDRYRGDKVSETAELSGLCRALAKELDCCVLLLCQLNRQVENRDDKRPTLADLKWSGEIEQDAHVVAFLYREAYYLQQQADPDPGALKAAKYQLDLLVRKNRNGEQCDIRLWCSIAHSSIRDDMQ